MKKRILNTVLAAFFTIVIYWMIILAVNKSPYSIYFFVAAHIELCNILFGVINFGLYILIKKNRHKNMLLYYVSATVWNLLAMYEVRGDEGGLWIGVYTERSLITLGILFFIYFIVLKYLDYRRKEINNTMSK